ncbi:MAG: hypothetical protein COA92_03770 [Sulfurovum sp.]|nr:MAG: hypothetical protein COA92_03770 [Sulfurovum sp.]
MNILLINDNPVVSRLLVLCTRGEHIQLEEVQTIEHIARKSYDVVFIDEALYLGKVQNLNAILAIQKKILLSKEDIEISDFDMTIKKPFLPSQIIKVLENINEQYKEETDILEVENEEVVELTSSSNTNVLDSNEIEKIKELLNMDEDEQELHKAELSEEEYERRKVEAIKKQLIAEGLEIIDEDKILDELDVDSAEALASLALENTTAKKEKKKNKSNEKIKLSKYKKKKKEKEKKKSLKFTEDELERIEDAVEMAIGSLKKKQMKKLLKGKEIEVTIKLEGSQ